jgi:hypothetical protein
MVTEEQNEYTMFRSFDSIERLYSPVTITEKLHGTNAQIYIHDVDSPSELADNMTKGAKARSDASGLIVQAGSRTRWITPDDDNFGFAAWVEKNKEALAKVLGPGRHFGEWYGSGINSGYNLKGGEKRFALFNVRRWSGQDLSSVPGLEVVPTLYVGPYSDEEVSRVMEKLKTEGSAASPGFMRPEGIVVRFERNGATFKHIFEKESFEGPRKEKSKDPGPAINQEQVQDRLQPFRLEKLLSRDERYLREYPKSLPDIARDYLADVEKEGGLEDMAEPEQKSLRKQVFGWIKGQMTARGYS